MKIEMKKWNNTRIKLGTKPMDILFQMTHDTL